MDLELDAFECPICLSLFQGSIFQCKNGHVLCGACLLRIHGTCPSCREPVGGDIRCRALENVIASMALHPCAFSSNGCTELLRLTERRDHEALCQHAPLACPFQGCAYSGLLLYDHIHNAHTDYVVSFAGSAWWLSLHRSRPLKVLLDPLERRVFLLLNCRHVRSGRSLSLICLGPYPAPNQLLEYKLKVRGAGQPGKLSLSACSVPCIRSWAGQHPTDGFLFVPDGYWTSLDSILVNVHVQKSTVNNAGTWRWSSLPAPCPCSEVDSPRPEVDSYWSSLARWLRHPTLETFGLLLVLAVFVFSAMAVLALAWKTSPTTPTSNTCSVPERTTLWDTYISQFF